MTITLETNVNLKGGRYYAHIKCSTSKGTTTRTVRCPRIVVNPTTFTSYNDQQLSAADSCAIQTRTKDKGGLRPKISKNMFVYKAFTSFNKSEIQNMISRLGVSKSVSYIAQSLSSELRSMINSSISDTLASLVETTVEAIEDILEELEEIADSEEVQVRETIYEIIEDTRVCLDIITDLKIVYDYSNNDGYKILFNDLSGYQDYKRYGLYNTTGPGSEYTIENIPFNHPLALINKGVNRRGDCIDNFITYTGTSIPQYKVVEIGDQRNWKVYPFYTGTISITVNGNFLYSDGNFIDGGVSLYHYELGYMGMENAFIYTTDCAGGDADVEEPHADCIDMSSVTVTNGTDSYGNPIYIFDGDTYLSYGYSFNTGTYLFANISENTPMNMIINNSSIAIFSGNDLSAVVVDDINYYYGETYLTVKEAFLEDDIILVYYDTTTDVSYVQADVSFNTSCKIELTGAIENITVQMFTLLTNFQNDLYDLDITPNQLLINKIEELTVLLEIVGLLVDWVIKYYTSNGILDFSDEEAITGVSDIDLVTTTKTIETYITNAKQTLEYALDIATDTAEIEAAAASAAAAAAAAQASTTIVLNAQKGYITAAAATPTSLDFVLDPFTNNDIIETVTPTFLTERWFEDSLLIEFISSDDNIDDNILSFNLAGTQPDISNLVYKDKGNSRYKIEGELIDNAFTTSADYITLSGDYLSFDITTSGYYFDEISYELWYKLDNAVTNHTLLEDLSRNIIISDDNTDWSHLVKTYTVNDNIESTYINGVFDSSYTNSINNDLVSNYSNGDRLKIYGLDDTTIHLSKFSVYNRVLSELDISFLSLQDRTADVSNLDYVFSNTKKYYKFESCLENNDSLLEILPINIDYTDVTNLIDGDELWDEDIGFSFPYFGSSTTLDNTTIIGNIKFEIVIIYSNITVNKFPNSLTAAELKSDYSNNIVEFSNFKNNVDIPINKITLNNLNTESINRPVIVLNDEMDYILTLLNNWGIGLSIEGNPYVAMYSVY